MPTPNNVSDWQTVEHPAINDWQTVPATSPHADLGFIPATTANTPHADLGFVPATTANTPQGKYQQIVDLTGRMVKAGEMTRDEELQVHKSLAAKGYGGPGVPAPPTPPALQTDQQRAAQQSQSAARLAPYAPNSLAAVNPPFYANGTAGMDKLMNAPAVASRPGFDSKLQAASDVIRGMGQVAAPLALPFAVAANPVGTAVGVGAGLLGSAAAGYAGHAAKLSPGAQALLEDVGGIGGGAVGGRYAEPAVKGLLSGVGKGAKAVLGATTSRGAAGITAAMKGSPEFINAMRGNTTEADAAAALTAARDQLKARTSAQYRSDLAALPTAPLPLAARIPTRIEDGLNGLLDKFGVRGDNDGNLDFSRSTIADPSAQNEVRGIVKDVQSWGDHPSDFSPKGLNTLKRRIRDSYSETSPARAITTGMGNHVSSILKEHVPGYEAMQKSYANGTGLVDDVNSEMGVDAANPGTPIRKILATSQNGSTYRTDLLNRLDAAAGTNVSDTIAGLGFRDWAPGRTAASLPVAAGGAAAYTGHPLGAMAAGLGLLSESPRLVGESAAALGRVPALNYHAPWRIGAGAGLLSTDQ